ncbi:YihY/virulence factor BrkB family protein [Mesorhizobium sp. M0047]|uniref:YihY/virulence factor BrkB family protein n=1 Tax=Mesorhizobium sp. M0047 TaxID=2956859 RepID=UPI0033367980
MTTTATGQPENRSLHKRDFTPFWVPAATLVLLAFGFSPRRYAAPAATPLHEENSDAGQQRLTNRFASSFASWRNILLRVKTGITEHRVLAIAAGIAFYTILAIFPAIAALVAVYGLFADPQTIASHFDRISGLLPAGALEVIRNQMQHIASQRSGTLGLAFIIGLAASLWSANAGVKALFDALNIIYGEKEKRGFFRINAVSLAFTMGGIVLGLLAIGAAVAVPILLSFVGLSGATDLLIRILRWPVVLAIVALGFALLYRFGPSRQRAPWRWISWGSAVAALGWLVGSFLFSWYAGNFGNYNETYGSLGGIIGFLIWIWISSIVILVGGELDHAMQNSNARFNNPDFPPFRKKAASPVFDVKSTNDRRQG